MVSLPRSVLEGLAEALGPRRPAPRQLDLFELTAALDVDGRPVDVGQAVELVPEGDVGTMIEIRCRFWNGGWGVAVELDGGPISNRGSHQVRGL